MATFDPPPPTKKGQQITTACAAALKQMRLSPLSAPQRLKYKRENNKRKYIEARSEQGIDE